MMALGWAVPGIGTAPPASAHDELGIGIFFQMLCEDTSDIFLRCREGKLAAEEICNRTFCRVTMPIN